MDRKRIIVAAMALAHKSTLAQWDAMMDHEAKRYLSDAERAIAASDLYMNGDESVFPLTSERVGDVSVERFLNG